MLPGHALFSLDEAKRVLGVRPNDAMSDEKLEDLIVQATALIEEACDGRRLVYRPVADPEELGADTSGAITIATPTSTPFLPGLRWTTAPSTSQAVATVVIVGTTPAGAAFTETLTLERGFSVAYARRVAGTIASVTLETGYAGASVTVLAAPPIVERHACAGDLTVRLINRPIRHLALVEEAIQGQGWTQVGSASFEALNDTGELKRTSEASLPWADCVFPEDLPLSFGLNRSPSWQDARVTFFAGFASRAEAAGRIRDQAEYALIRLWDERGGQGGTHGSDAEVQVGDIATHRRSLTWRLKIRSVLAGEGGSGAATLASVA